MHTTARKEKLRRIPHLIIGLLTLLHGYERLEHGHTHYPVFFVAGIVFLGVALLHHRLAARFPWADAVFFFLEAIIAFIIAGEFFTAGKGLLGACYCLAGTLQLVALGIFYRKSRSRVPGHP